MVQQKKQQDNFYALASIFILTTGLLTVVRIYTPLDILLMDRFFPGWGWVQIFILGVYSVFLATARI